MVLTPNDSNSSSSTPATPRQLRDHLLASPQEAGYLCQYCFKRFLTLQCLGGHQQETHQTELNLLSTEEPRRQVNLEERVQALGGAIMRAQRHVLQSSTRRAMAPGDESSSLSYNVGDDDDGGEDHYIITLPNFFGSNVTPRPHAYGFGAGDETPTEVLPPDSSNGGRLVQVGFCLNHLVRESYLMYPPPGFEPLMGESSAGDNVRAVEGENEAEGEVEGDGGEEKDGNESPLHEELDLTLKL